MTTHTCPECGDESIDYERPFEYDECDSFFPVPKFRS
jgi:predicted RNA-binding Zn-ribbon protein involved in translation (DUF1610 family)